MAKAKRVKLYNKGTREWTLKDNGEDVICEPNRTIDLDEAQAKKLMAGYPHDFIFSGDVPAKGNREVKNLKAEVARLTAENEKLKAQIATMMEPPKTENKQGD